MLIKRKSPLTGKTNEMDINVTEEELEAWFSHGVLIQVAMPDLTIEEREFIKSGHTQEDWDAMFGDEP